MADKRTFIAIDISAAARAASEHHIDNLRRNFPDVRVGWEKPEKLHITLKFLGATEVAVLRGLEEKLAGFAFTHPPFVLSLSKAGVFPSKSRPRILWIGVEDASGTTASLYKAIEATSAALGFEEEKREFHPHLTIGRVREPHRAAALAEHHLKAHIQPVEFNVADLVLYESKLRPSGSVYSSLFRVNLGARSGSRR